MMKYFSYMLIVLVIVVLNLFVCCDAKCSPSACGVLSNISSPFRLKGDPKNCGDRRFELRCKDNVTSISLNHHNYYVKAINYQNSTIRLVDASIVKNDMCSFPIVSSYSFTFLYDNPNPIPYRIPTTQNPINFVSCSHQLNNSSFFTDVTTHCASSSSSLLSTHAYIKVGHLNASELPHLCTVELIVLTSWPEFKDFDNVSLSEIHQSLLYGFELVVCLKCYYNTRKAQVVITSINTFLLFIYVLMLFHSDKCSQIFSIQLRRYTPFSLILSSLIIVCLTKGYLYTYL